MVTGLAMINRLALAHGRSQREGAAATDPAVQLIPLGGVKDTPPRLAPWKSRRGGGCRKAIAMALHVSPKKPLDRTQDNRLRVAVKNPRRHRPRAIVVAPQLSHTHTQKRADAPLAAAIPRCRHSSANVMAAHVPGRHQSPVAGA
jgi:hypothetical protein